MTTHFSSQKVDSLRYRHDRGVVNTVFLVQHPIWHNISVNNIQLVFFVVINLVLVTVKVPPFLPEI